MITNEQIIEAIISIISNGNIHPTELLEGCFDEELSIERWNEFKEYINQL